MEYDVNFAHAPDPPLLEGEIGNTDFDFDDFDEPQDPSKVTAKNVEAHQEAVDQSDQEAVKTPNLNECQPQISNDAPAEQSKSPEEPVPNPGPAENPPAMKAPAR